jgi:hypothetical protein
VLRIVLLLPGTIFGAPDCELSICVCEEGPILVAAAEGDGEPAAEATIVDSEPGDGVGLAVPDSCGASHELSKTSPSARVRHKLRTPLSPGEEATAARLLIIGAKQARNVPDDAYCVLRRGGRQLSL